MTIELTDNTEIFTTIKKLSPLVLKSSLSITVCSIFVIWFYLSSLGRLDVFTEAIGFNSLLGIVFGFTLIVFISFCTLIFIPSLILSLIIYGKEKKFFKKQAVVNSFISINILNGWLFGFISIIFFFLSYKFKEYEKELIIPWLMLFAITSLILTHWEFNKSSLIRNQRIKIKRKACIKLSLIFIIPSFTQIIPFSFFLSQITFEKQTNDFVQILFIFILFIAFSTISFLPGIQFISNFKNSIVRNTILTFTLSIVSLIALTFIIPTIPIMIANATMNLTGIADWRTHQFAIKEKNYPHSMFSGKQWNTRYYAGIPDHFFITGVATFSFGDIKLICPISIHEARIENMKFNPNNPEENQKKSETFKYAATPCFSIDKKDIKQWDSPLSDPTYYEKIRLTTPRFPSDIFNYLNKK
ncbi:hypothetical protein RF240_03510 [Dickeya dadantii]|uniref:hypothetical protein n=1 Tax=Dickeya dadantii TaxID=204038 RepID=UPI0035A843ED